MPKIELHVRHALLYEFELGHSAAEAYRNIVRVIGPDVISEPSCRVWFQRFREGNYSLDDRPRTGRPTEVDLDLVRSLIEANPYETTRSLAVTLGCSKTSIENALHAIGKVSKLAQWVPSDLSETSRQRRVDCCIQLLSRKRHFHWLDNIVTGDEKWCLYVNHTRKRQWVNTQERPKPEPKTDVHTKKVLLSVWWGVRGIYHWEILPDNTTITASVYTEQLRRLSEKIEKLHPKIERVALLHDNARPHVAKMTQLEIVRLGWEVLPHAPYSPDLAPSDYYLFRSLGNFLRDKKYDQRADLESDLTRFFGSQPEEFWKDGIHSLPERWRRVIDNDGAYIID